MGNRQQSRLPKVLISPIASKHTRTLIRDLVRQAREAKTARGAAPDSATVLLDVEVDGVRCTLVRAEPAKQARPLSDRELAIARMITEGHSNKVIAEILAISAWTVDTHVRRIFAKMGVRTRAAMVTRIVSGGLLERSVTTPTAEETEHHQMD